MSLSFFSFKFSSIISLSKLAEIIAMVAVNPPKPWTSIATDKVGSGWRWVVVGGGWWWSLSVGGGWLSEWVSLQKMFRFPRNCLLCASEGDNAVSFSDSSCCSI